MKEGGAATARGSGLCQRRDPPLRLLVGGLAAALSLAGGGEAPVSRWSRFGRGGMVLPRWSPLPRQDRGTHRLLGRERAAGGPHTHLHPRLQPRAAPRSGVDAPAGSRLTAPAGSSWRSWGLMLEDGDESGCQHRLLSAERVGV